MSDLIWFVTWGEHSSWGSHHRSETQVFTDEDKARERFGEVVTAQRLALGGYDLLEEWAGEVHPEGRFADLKACPSGHTIDSDNDGNTWSPKGDEVETWSWSTETDQLEAYLQSVEDRDLPGKEQIAMLVRRRIASLQAS